MKYTTLPIFFLCATAVCVLSSCSQSSREEAIDRVSDAAKTLNGNPDATPDIVKAQQKKDRERQNSQWTTENTTRHPVEACNAKLDEIEASEQKAMVHYNKALSMKLASERAKRAAESEVKKFSEFLSSAKSLWTAASTAGKWPVELNGYPFSQDELKSKMTEALKKKASAEQRVKDESTKVMQADAALKQIQATRKRLGEDKERVLAIKRNVELGAFQNDLDGFAKALNGGVSLDDLEAVGQTTGAVLSPDVFTPSESTEDAAMLDAFLAE